MSSGNGGPHDKPPGDYLVVEVTGLAAQQQQDLLDLHLKDDYYLVAAGTDFSNGKSFLYLYQREKGGH